MKISLNDLSRFYSKTQFNGLTGCLEWTGATDGFGYGSFSYQNQAQGAHRWMLIRCIASKGMYTLAKIRISIPNAVGVNAARVYVTGHVRLRLEREQPMIIYVVVLWCHGHADLHSVHSTENKADSEALRLEAKYKYHTYDVIPLEIDGPGFSI